MKTNTFTHLEALCAGKGIVCERRGRKIELTTPCGGTCAECDNVRDALDTVRNDDTFAGLPIRMRAAVAEPTPEERERLQRIIRAQDRLRCSDTGNTACAALMMAMKYLRKCNQREWFEIQTIVNEEAGYRPLSNP